MIGDEISLGENVMDGFVIGAVAALVGAIIDLVVTNMTLKDNLDSKSEWRKELFGVASSDKVSFESINILRATLRYRPKEFTSPKDILTPLKKALYWSVGILILLIIILIISVNVPKSDTITFLSSMGSIILAYVIILYLCRIKKFKKELGYTKIYKVKARGSSLDFYASTFAIEIGDSQYDLDYTKCEVKEIFKSEIDVFDLTKLVDMKFKFGSERQADYGKINIDDFPLFYFNFDSITKTIIDFCVSASVKGINDITAKKTKIYTMYMLKHHWEELSVPNYRFIKKIQIRINNNYIIKELIKDIVKMKSNEENSNVCERDSSGGINSTDEDTNNNDSNPGNQGDSE